MQFVLGALGFVALGATLLFATRGTERVAARLLGLPTFRWFEAAAAPGWTGKRFLVRVVSATVPFAICATLFFVVLLVGGVQEPTTTVEVLAGGAAQEAGMRDGDKVLAVGSVPVHTWDEARAQIQAHSDPVRLTLERAGQRHELLVTPRGRRIGVAPVSVTRPVGILAAAMQSVRTPLAVVAEAAKSVVALHHTTSELKGPVGIVRDTGQAAKAGWLSYLHFLAVLGSYFWPFAAALHLFDVVTGWTFRLTFTETDLPERTLRIARLRFSMHFALGCWLAFLLAEAAAGFDLPGALLLVALLMPGVWALWPLLWVSARELWGKWSPFGVTLPGLGALPSSADGRLDGTMPEERRAPPPLAPDDGLDLLLQPSRQRAPAASSHTNVSRLERRAVSRSRPASPRPEEAPAKTEGNANGRTGTSVAI